MPTFKLWRTTTVLTANEAIGNAGRVFKANATSGAQTHAVVAPGQDGRELYVVKTDSSANTVTLTLSLDGAATSIVLAYKGDAVKLYDDGTTWTVLGNRPSAASLSTTYLADKYLPLSLLRFGADPTGVNDSTTAVQAWLNALVSSSAFGAKYKGFAPAGNYKCTAQITIPLGVVVEGASSHASGTVFNFASMAAGSTGGFVTSGFWHHGLLRNFRVATSPSHGIYISGGLGEAAVIDQVASYYNAADGIRIEGPSTPLHLGRLTLHHNGTAGLRLVNQSYTGVLVDYVAGDNNGESLVTVDGGNTSSIVTIKSWKSERSTNGAFAVGNPNVFVLNNLNGGYVNVGEGQAVTTTGGTGGNALIQQNATSGNSVGRVKWRMGYTEGSGGVGYLYGYQDTAHATTLALADACRATVSLREPYSVVYLDGTAYSQMLAVPGTGTVLYYGTISPAGTVSAPAGSLFLRQNGISSVPYMNTSAASPGTTWSAIPVGASSAPDVAQPVKSGKYVYPMGGAASTSTPAAGQVRYAPVFIDANATVASIGLQVTVAGTTGAQVRIGLYADNGGYPSGAPLIDSGALDATATGWKSATASVAVTPGRYWVAAVNQGAPTTNAQWQIISGMLPGVVGYGPSQANLGGYQDGTANTASALSSSPNVAGNTGGPLVGLQFA